MSMRGGAGMSGGESLVVDIDGGGNLPRFATVGSR